MNDFQFLALGGAREIGANSFYYKFGSHGVLIDAGLHPEKTGWDAFPKTELLAPDSVGTFIITHAHADHIGGVPYVLQSQPQARVIATAETIQICEIMLANSAGLLPRQHPKEVIDKLTNYTEEKLPEVIGAIEPFRFGATRTIGTNGESLRASFFMSGHILGAAGILFEYGGKRVYHTGDIAMHDQYLIGKADLPHAPVDILVTESTNGLWDAYLTHSRDQELTRLLEVISQTITEGGSVLIPCFALGKMQEALVMLWDAMCVGRIPSVNIYTGGLGRRISEIYDKNQYSGSRIRTDKLTADIPQQELPRRDGLFGGKFFKEPSIVLASSGMMQEGTASYLLAQRWLRHQHFAICFIGYTDPRTPGFAVANAQRGKRLRFGSMKREVPVRCRIERFRFSAHARRDGLLEIVEKLQPKYVVMTHGDTQAMNSLGESVLEHFPGTKVSAPEIGKWYRLANGEAGRGV